MAATCSGALAPIQQWAYLSDELSQADGCSTGQGFEQLGLRTTADSLSDGGLDAGDFGVQHPDLGDRPSDDGRKNIRVDRHRGDRGSSKSADEFSGSFPAPYA